MGFFVLFYVKLFTVHVVYEGKIIRAANEVVIPTNTRVCNPSGLNLFFCEKISEKYNVCERCRNRFDDEPLPSILLLQASIAVINLYKNYIKHLSLIKISV